MLLIRVHAGCRNDRGKCMGTSVFKEVNCISVRDSCVGISCQVRYIRINESYAVEVEIKGVTDTVPFRFDCRTPVVLVPALYKVKEEKIFLVHGCGFTYGKVFVCTKMEGRINISTYETNRAEVDAPDFFASKEADNDGRIFVVDRVSNGVTTFRIAPANKRNHIKEFNIYKHSIGIIYENGKTEIVLLRR